MTFMYRRSCIADAFVIDAQIALQVPNQLGACDRHSQSCRPGQWHAKGADGSASVRAQPCLNSSAAVPNVSLFLEHPVPADILSGDTTRFRECDDTCTTR